MAESILASVKRAIGIHQDETEFDLDLIMHINSTFAKLNQLGVGPKISFEIDGNEQTWDQFILGNPNLNGVKTYVYMAVRYIFDPPTTSFALDAIKKQLDEYEWRLNVVAEEVKHPWTEPISSSTTESWE